MTPSYSHEDDEALLDELRRLHYEERAPESSRQRALEALPSRVASRASQSSLGSWRRWRDRVASAGSGGEGEGDRTPRAIHRPWARLALALALVLGIGVAHELGEQERSARSPSSSGEVSASAPQRGAARRAAESGADARCVGSEGRASPAAEPLDAEALAAGFTLHTFVQRGLGACWIMRRYLQYVPETAAAPAPPVLLLLWGSGDRSELALGGAPVRQVAALARREGLITVSASLVERQPAERAALDAGPPASPQELSEAGYLAQVVQDLQQRGVITEDSAIFLVGHGEGANLALQAAALRPDLYSGAAALMPGGSSPLPHLEPGARLSRVLFLSLEKSTRSLVHDWALALGISHDVIERSRPVVLAPPGAEPRPVHRRPGLEAAALEARVERFDLDSPVAGGASVRALFISKGGPSTLELPSSLAGSRAAERREPVVRGIDAVAEAWRFLSGARER